MRGVGASPGLAVGRAFALFGVSGGGCRVAETPAAALEAAAVRLDELAAGASGTEPEILSAGAMMARDPALLAAVEAEVAKGATLAQALIDATEAYAEQLEAIDDPTLAARAEDVRSIGRRAAYPDTRHPPPDTPVVIVAPTWAPPTSPNSRRKQSRSR